MVLVHGKMQLADPEMLPIVRYQAKEVLLEKGVEVLLGENTHVRSVQTSSASVHVYRNVCDLAGHKVSNLSELKLNVTTKNMQVLTDKGERINTDLIICCTGLRVNSSAYKSSFCQYAQTHTHRYTLTVPHPQVHTYSYAHTQIYTHRYTPTVTHTQIYTHSHTQIHRKM